MEIYRAGRMLREEPKTPQAVNNEYLGRESFPDNKTIDRIPEWKGQGCGAEKTKQQVGNSGVSLPSPLLLLCDQA